MINEQLYTAINQQVTEEYAAAYIYRHLANEMDALSFPGLCEWFAAQAAEECEHALKFAKHLIDRGERVCPHPIEIDAPKIAGPLEAFKAALEHEKKVSEQIRTITRLADEVGDLESRPLLNWFLNEQIEEEATVSEIVGRVKLINDDGPGLLRLDEELGKRPTESTEA